MYFCDSYLVPLSAPTAEITMKNGDQLNSMLGTFLESKAGKQLVHELGESKRYLRLAHGEKCMGYLPIFLLDGTGLRCVTESSALTAAFTSTPQDVSFENSTIEEVVTAITEESGHCCAESFMYWLEKRTAEADGIELLKAA